MLHWVLYAFGSLAGNALFQSYSLWLVYYYAPPPDRGLPTLVPLAALGFILGATQLVGLVNGPLVGFLSDRTRTSLGRRAPYVLFGAPVLVAAFVLLWRPPDAGPTTGNAVYLFGALLFFLLGYTAVMGPYDALLPEIARTSRDRVTVASLKVVTGTAGSGVGLVATAPLIELIGFQGMAVTVAGVALVCYGLTLLGTRSVLVPWSPSTLSLGSSLMATFSNPPFLALVASLGLLLLGQNLLIQLIPYFATVILRGPEGTVSFLTGALMTVVGLTLPVLPRLSRRWDKKRITSVASLGLGLYLPTLSLLGAGAEEAPELALGMAAIGVLGLAIAVLYVFPIALLADVVDFDALRTGQRREAMYFGVSATLTKLAFVVAAVLFVGVLDLFGFSSENPTGIRLMPAVAGACVLLGWAVFQWGYRLED